MNDSTPFERFPATRHQNAYGLDFADGHAEIYHLRTSAAQVAENQPEAFATELVPTIAKENSDWIRLKQVTTSP
jgi:hypothetical protein